MTETTRRVTLDIPEAWVPLLMSVWVKVDEEPDTLEQRMFNALLEYVTTIEISEQDKRQKP